MMLGKRARPPMKRTTSMTAFSLDFRATGEGVFQPLDPHDAGLDQWFSGSATPRPHRRNSADFVETAQFLRICTLCNSRLIPGHDIYMYRGDSAFCSLECRQQRMTQDERKDKCSMASKKGGATTTAAGSQITATGETVTAL